MPEQRSKPRVVPVLIACWSAWILFAFVLGPTSQLVSAGRQAAPNYASAMGLLVVLAAVGVVWSAVGPARLHTRPVGFTLFVLIGYPLFVVAKALVTGYFSSRVFSLLLFIILVNGLCAWYLLGSKVRAFWWPPRSAASA